MNLLRAILNEGYLDFSTLHKYVPVEKNGQMGLVLGFHKRRSSLDVCPFICGVIGRNIYSMMVLVSRPMNGVIRH